MKNLPLLIAFASIPIVCLALITVSRVITNIVIKADMEASAYYQAVTQSEELGELLSLAPATAETIFLVQWTRRIPSQFTKEFRMSADIGIQTVFGRKLRRGARNYRGLGYICHGLEGVSNANYGLIEKFSDELEKAIDSELGSELLGKSRVTGGTIEVEGIDKRPRWISFPCDGYLLTSDVDSSRMREDAVKFEDPLKLDPIMNNVSWVSDSVVLVRKYSMSTERTDFSPFSDLFLEKSDDDIRSLRLFAEVRSSTPNHINIKIRSRDIEFSMAFANFLIRKLRDVAGPVVVANGQLDDIEQVETTLNLSDHAQLTAAKTLLALGGIYF